MEDKKSYYVQIPGTQQGQTWDEDKYNRNADKLREKYPDAVVMETSPYTDGDFADDDLFRVQIPGTAQGQTWDGAKFRRNREALMSKYPDVSISRFSPISGAVQSELNFNDEPQGHASELDEAYWNQHRTALDNINRQISEKLAGQKELDEEMERIYSQEAAELGYAPAISQRHRDAQESYKTSLNDLYRQRHDNPAYQQEVSTSRTAISTASKSVQDRIDKLTADNAEDYANFAASERPEAGPAPSGGYYKQNNPKFEGDYRLLRAAKAFYSDADKTITAPSRYDDSHWIGNLVEGITDNPQKLISLLDLHDQYIKQPLMTVVNKIQKKEGEHVNLIEYIQSENAQKDLSENEREVIKALIAKTAAETLRAGDISLAYQSGETIAGSVGFMLDFILTNKIGTAAGKAATNWMTRGLAKAVNNAGINYTERVAAEAVPKFLIGTVESAAKTAATTPFMPSSYANFANQMMQMNEAGQVDLSGKALANKFFDVLIENFSEYAGLQVEGILGAPLKAFRKGAGWAFDKIGWEKWGDMISHYRAPKILKQAAFNGYLGEYGEEWYGNAIRVMTGVDKDALKNFSAVEQQIVTLSSFAPMSLFGAGSSIAQQRRAGKKLENAAETLQNVLKENGYDEKTISNILDVTKAENPSDLARQLAPVVNQVANDNGRAGDVYKAVCDYAYAVAKYRTFDGINDADITAEREQMAGEITQALGNENWIHTKPVTINKKDGTTDEVEMNSVRMLRKKMLGDADEGKDYFVIGEDEDGTLAVSDMQGNKKFILLHEAAQYQDTGWIALRDFLDRSLTAKKQETEAARMQREEEENISALYDAVKGRTTWDIGSPEQPMEVPIVEIREGADGGLLVKTTGENGEEGKFIPWNEVAAKLNMPASAKTDEELEEEQLDKRAQATELNKTVPDNADLQVPILGEEGQYDTYKFIRADIDDGEVVIMALNPEGEEVTLAPEQISNLQGYVEAAAAEEAAAEQNEPQIEDNAPAKAEEPAEKEQIFDDPIANELGISKDFLTVTKKGRRVVNSNALWAANPALLAQYNDKTNILGMNTVEYLTEKVDQVDKEISKQEALLKKEVLGANDEDRKEDIKDKITELTERRKEIAGVLQPYMDAMKAAEEAAAAEKAALEQEKAEAKAEKAANEDPALREPMTLEEAVANFISGLKKGSLNKEDFMRELGWSDEEAKRFFPYWAGTGKGMTLLKLAEQIGHEDTSGFVPQHGEADQADTQAIRDAVIDVLQSSVSPKDVTDYTKRRNLDRRMQMDEYAKGLEEFEAQQAEAATEPAPIVEDMPEAVANPVQQEIASAREEVNTEPTEAQKEAGNYKKGHIQLDGYEISIENPKGSIRKGTDASGKEWQQVMNNDYGYIRMTEGVDGDHIDVFLSDNPTEGNVFVIDQRNPQTGEFDEHKVMYGFNSAEEARAAYLANYEEGWQGLGAITEVTKDEFRKWIDSSHRKTKPFSEYKSVKAEGAQNEAAVPVELNEENYRAAYDIWKNRANATPEALQQAIGFYEAELADAQRRYKDLWEKRALGEVISDLDVEAQQKIAGRDTKKLKDLREQVEKNSTLEDMPEDIFSLLGTTRDQAVTDRLQDKLTDIDNRLVADAKGGKLTKDSYVALMDEKTAALQEFADAMSTDRNIETVATQLAKLRDVLIEKGVNPYSIQKTLSAVSEVMAHGEYPRGFKLAGKVFLLADNIANGQMGRRTHTHEEEHLVTRANGDAIKLASMPEFSRESALNAIDTMNGFRSETYHRLNNENVADELIAHGVEFGEDMSDADFDKFMQSVGVDNEEITNFVKNRIHERRARKRKLLSEDGRRGRTDALEHVSTQGDLGQDERNLEPRSEGNVGEQGHRAVQSGSSGVGEGGQVAGGESAGRSDSEHPDANHAGAVRRAGEDLKPAERARLEDLDRDGTGKPDIIDNLNDATEGTSLFSLDKKNRSLVGLHNISAEKLRKAIHLGGFANPSCAVIDLNYQNHFEYGDITFLLPSDLVGKRTGRNAGTWVRDAWTPTFPKITFHETKESQKNLKELLKDLPKDLRFLIDRKIYDFINEDTYHSGLEYLFLKEKGMEPEIQVNPRKYPNASEKEFFEKYLKQPEMSQSKTSGSDIMDAYEALSPEDRKMANMYVLCDGDMSKIEHALEMEEKWPHLKEVHEEPLSFAALDSFLYKIMRDERDAGQENIGLTIEKAIETVGSDKALQDEFNAWQDKTIDDLGYEAKMFIGYTDNGRKYKKATLENVSKEMKKEGNAGAQQNSGLSFGSILASMAKKINSLSEIRANRNRLVSKDEYQQKREELMDKAKEFFFTFYDNNIAKRDGLYTAELVAADYVRDFFIKGHSIDKVVEDFNREQKKSLTLTDKEKAAFNAFRKELQDAPTDMFETKFERPVYINEFAAVVIPDDTPLDVRQTLEQIGLKLYEYKGDERSDERAAAVRKAAEENDGVLFSFIGKRGAEAMDIEDKTRERRDNLAVARQMEKDKATPGAIKWATGWERGADGMWRYEIPDFTKLDLFGDVMYDKRHPDHVRYKELLRKTNAAALMPESHEPLTTEEMDEFNNLYRKYNGGVKRDMLEYGMLEDFIDADDLFKAYPQLRRYALRFEDLPDRVGGYAEKRGVVLNMKNRFQYEKISDDLLHEIQHEIQDIEGFSLGTSLDAAERKARVLNSQPKDALTGREWDFVDLVRLWIIRDVASKAANPLDHWLADWHKDGLYSDELYKEMIEGKSADELKKLYNQLLIKSKKKQVLSSWDVYKRTAGEVEARNASRRRKFTLEERRASAAENTEDVSRADQILNMPASSLLDWTDDEDFSVAMQAQKQPGKTYIKADEDDIAFSLAYHGSGADYDRFDISHALEGEGAMAHGYGHYVALNKDVAKGYAYAADEARRGREIRSAVQLQLDKAPSYYAKELLLATVQEMESGVPFEVSKAKTLNMLKKAEEKRKAGRVDDYWKKTSNAKEIEFFEGLNNLDIPQWNHSRNLYTVDIPDDTGENYIHEKKELSKAQRNRIAEALRALPEDAWKHTEDDRKLFGDHTAASLANSLSKRLLNGYEIYAELNHGLGSMKAASKFLSDAGFVGIKYNGGVDGPCAVIFNDEDIKIEEHAMFSLGKNNRSIIEKWLDKREDLSKAQKAAFVGWLDGLSNPTLQLATARWFTQGAIRLPEDMPKVEQAVSVAGKAKVDPLQYGSPMALLEAHADFKPTEKRINPDEVSTLHKAKDFKEHGITVYDVDDSEESRQNMRQIINTHFGKEASPWCLLQGDSNGNLTESSAEYWKHYNAYPKQVAFKDGKLLAFSANDDKRVRLWWDRQDSPHYDIPAGWRLIKGDALGREVQYVYSENGMLKPEENSFMKKGNRENGEYTEWYPNGNLSEHGFYKNGKNDGLYETYNERRGYLYSRINYKEGVQEGLSEYFHPNGTLRSRTNWKDGKIDGTHELFHDDGSLSYIRHYKGGSYDGLAASYNRDGTPIETLEFKNGREHGKHEMYFSDGKQVKLVEYYDDGKLHGAKIKYDYDGYPRSIENYVYGKRQGVQEYYDYGHGKLALRITEKDNIVRKSEGFNSDGTISFVKRYNEYGEPDGVWKFWTRDGKLDRMLQFENGVEIRDLLAEGVTEQEADVDAPSFSFVSKEEQERLDKEPTVTMYRAMALVDGKLYPPMSSKEPNGPGEKGKRLQMRPASELGRWERADEAPEKAKEGKDGKYYFDLKKSNGESVDGVLYNPYFHTSASPLNDQFTGASNRPELVTVEVEVPMSELAGKYKADKAADSVGPKDWHSGTVTAQMGGGRQVVLSRWVKPVRIVPDAEVAAIVAPKLKEKGIAVPANVVTPSLLAELRKQGVSIAGEQNEPMFSLLKDSGELPYEGRLFDDDLKPIRYESMGVLPAGKAYTCLVKRVFTKDNSFNFSSGKEKIEGAADVAYIFRQLENKAIENSFLVFIKDGVPTIVHTGMGTNSATMIDSSPLVVGIKEFEPDEIYMVHNHPSGDIRASKADIESLSKLQKAAWVLKKEHIPVEGIIIDTLSGKFGRFDNDDLTGITEWKKYGEKDVNYPIEVLKFDDAVFSPDYVQDVQIKGAKDIAAYLSSHRLGDGSKLNALLLDGANHIVGNLVLNSNVLDNSNIAEQARNIAYASTKCNAKAFILNGDFGVDGRLLKSLTALIGQMTDNKVSLLDVVKIDGNHSRSLKEGTLNEPGTKKAPASAILREQAPFKVTDVTSADGAKIINNLNTFAKDVENLSLRAKRSFIRDLAVILGATSDGSNSTYASFETKNGKIITFRLSNHNARVSTFDNRGETYGVSIVISRKSNNGIIDDGDAHVVEFFYPDKALRKADNNPYAKIVQSITQALYSGEYKDATGLAIAQDVNGDVSLEDSSSAYHSRLYDISAAEKDGFKGIMDADERKDLRNAIYNIVPQSIREQIVDEALGNGMNIGKALDSYLQRLAEGGTQNDETGLLRALYNQIRDITGNDNLTDEDCRYIIWNEGHGPVADDDIFGLISQRAHKKRFGAGEEAPMFSARSEFGEATDEAREVAKEKVDEAKAELDETKKEARREAKQSALKAITLAMRGQKYYDKKTVDAVVKYAKEILRNGRIASLSRTEVNRLLGLVATSTGKAPAYVKRYVDQLTDTMLDIIVRDEADAFKELMNTKDTKIDSHGVEVMGKVDILGQEMLKALRDYYNRPIDEIQARLSEISDKLSSKDDAIRKRAWAEKDGLELAEQYQRMIADNKAEEKALKNELADLKESKQSKAISAKDYADYVATTNEAIREGKLDRVDSYRQLSEVLKRLIKKSAEGRADFDDAEAKRVSDIQYDANRDMASEDSSVFNKESRLGRLVNNRIVRFFARPLATFDQMMRLFARHSITGEGYLYNRYMRGWLRARENYIDAISEAYAQMDAKASEVFGKKMKWTDLYKIDKHLPTMTVRMWDGEKMADIELRQGNLLYIYMANKMLDGKMKLRRMGISEDKVKAIRDNLDPRLVELADWLQGEHLPSLRNKYNAIHEQLFGAPMAAIEDYFPLKIAKGDIPENVDVSKESADSPLSSTVTGHIIKRTKNSRMLDIANANAFDIAVEHLESMEEWAAFARFRKDLNILLSYKHFRNQVKNMNTIYGSGDKLWQNFVDVSKIVAGTYRPEGKGTSLVNLSKGFTSGKINFRLHTALKQTLSYPAFWADARIDDLYHAAASPIDSWNWCMENLPVFKRRWEKRTVGDTRLMKTDSDWKVWQKNFVKAASRYGMVPNAFVDAVTISIGTKAVYDSKLRKYLSEGMSQEEAETKAKQDATIIYNQSQQSDENAFVSALQLDRTFEAAGLSTFRNASMGYQRRVHNAYRTLGRLLSGKKESYIAGMAKQYISEGLSPEQAKARAEQEYSRAGVKAAGEIFIYQFFLNFLWKLGPLGALYLIAGGDDDKKKKKLKDAALTTAITGFFEGLSMGGSLTDLTGGWVSGEGVRNWNFLSLPVLQDVQRLWETIDSHGFDTKSVFEIVSLLSQGFCGVDPHILSDTFNAVGDTANWDMGLMKEISLLLMRIGQSPQSQMKDFYIDEIKETRKKAGKQSAKELAERYVEYQRKRKDPIGTVIGSDDKETEKKDKAATTRLMNEAFPKKQK